MPDPIIVLTVVSGLTFVFAIGKSAWHGCKLERLLHRDPPARHERDR